MHELSIVLHSFINRGVDQSIMTQTFREKLVKTNDGYTYLLTPSPSNETVSLYLKILKEHSINIVVRLCEPKYDAEFLKNNNIIVHDIIVQDGTIGTNDQRQQWLNILQNYKNIAIHCDACLGRAPFFVCLGLILQSNMTPENAAIMIRNNVSGHALNTNQLHYLISLNSRKYSSCSIL